MKQKILYFVPDCPVAGAAGNITRFRQMLNYLNNAENCEVDFVSLSDWGDWDKETIKIFQQEYPHINLILLNRKVNGNFLKKIFLYKIPNAIPKLLRGTSVDITNPFLVRKFSKIINAKKYDKIIISYAVWGKLIKNIDYKAHLILDTHDFITAQNRNKKSKMGSFFQSEIDIINLFDEIWTFSMEEKYIFEQFSDKKVVHLPISFVHQPLIKGKEHKYDILYVASNNPHNVKAIGWFLDKVLPLLNPKYRVHIIGRICDEIKREYPNVEKYGLVEDISTFYENAKVVICPMLTGTGVKIKVLEALSYNLPVVTNTRGVDGLSNKSENGCIIQDNEKDFAEEIERLLSDEVFYTQTQQKAYEYFSKHHKIEKEIAFFNSQFS